jgi:hypothetical protein
MSETHQTNTALTVDHFGLFSESKLVDATVCAHIFFVEKKILRRQSGLLAA